MFNIFKKKVSEEVKTKKERDEPKADEQVQSNKKEKKGIKSMTTAYRLTQEDLEMAISEYLENKVGCNSEDLEFEYVIDNETKTLKEVVASHDSDF